MAARGDEQEEKRIEELASEAEILIKDDEDKRDLKERRGVIKQQLYDGSKKLKHAVPKGKHL